MYFSFFLQFLLTLSFCLWKLWLQLWKGSAISQLWQTSITFAFYSFGITLFAFKNWLLEDDHIIHSLPLELGFMGNHVIHVIYWLVNGKTYTILSVNVWNESHLFALSCSLSEWKTLCYTAWVAKSLLRISRLTWVGLERNYYVFLVFEYFLSDILAKGLWYLIFQSLRLNVVVGIRILDRIENKVAKIEQ